MWHRRTYQIPAYQSERGGVLQFHFFFVLGANPADTAASDSRLCAGSPAADPALLLR